MGGVTVVCTESQRVSDRPRAWQDSLGKVFSLLPIDVQVDEVFAGRMTYGSLADVTLCRMAMRGSHRVVRTRTGERDCENGPLNLVIQLKGTSAFMQNGRAIRMQEREWSLLDSDGSSALYPTDDVDCLMLLLPRERIQYGSLSLDDFTVRRFSARSGSGRLLVEFITAAFEELPTLHRQAEHDIAGTVCRMVRLALLENLQRQARTPGPEVLRERIKQYIDARLRDPSLSIDMIAEAMSCSKRYLHKVFREEHVSISEYVWRERLERCRADLCDPAMSDRSITDIAYSWGFNDSAHFSRTFGKVYGMSARRYRTAARVIASL